MSYREVSVIEVREVLRAWLGGAGLRTVAAQAGVDRKTVRRYVAAAEAAGVVRNGNAGQLNDEVIGSVVAAVRPARPEGHGSAWQLLIGQREQITLWVKQDLTVVKIDDLLARRGVMVPYRTLHRFCVECCGYSRSPSTTVRVADGEAGVECQIDVARLGLIADPSSGRRRVVHALIFTAVYSRHMFVWLTHSQTLVAVIAGCEAAWELCNALDPLWRPARTVAAAAPIVVAPSFDRIHWPPPLLEHRQSGRHGGHWHLGWHACPRRSRRSRRPPSPAR